MKLLIIEDDPVLSKNTQLFLEKQHYQIDVAQTGKAGLLRAMHYSYAVIILDWMLPDISGIDVLKQLREQHNTTPTIITTAKGQIEDKLEGFTTGTDDYLVKPYTLVELEARIQAIIRRVYAPNNSQVITIDQLTINRDIAQVNYKKKPVLLTPKEYAILELLALNLNKVVSRPNILHHVWQDDVDSFTNHVEVHIKNLRSKLGEGAKLIRTVKGHGYLLSNLP